MSNNRASKIIIYSIIACYLLPIIMIGITTYFSTSSGKSMFDYARITDVDYKAVVVDEVGEGGKVVITERLTFDIHAAKEDNPFRELWRALPEKDVDGLKVRYKVNYVKEILPDGTEVEYEQSPKLYWDDSDYVSPTYGPGKWFHSPGPYNESARLYECVLFYVDKYREKATFEIQYEMSNASLKYKDVSELYLTLYSEETIKYLKSFKAQILVPDKDMPKKGNYMVRTYGTNSHTFDYTESDTLNSGYHTFSFELDEKQLKFKPYNQFIEFMLLSYNEDAQIFTEYAPNNIYSNDVYYEEALQEIHDYDVLPQKYKTKKTNIFVICVVLSIILFFYIIFERDKNLRKKYTFYKSDSNIDYFRDIPSDLDPHFAAHLVFCKNKKEVNVDNSYSAILLNLVRKKYIEIKKVNEDKNWTKNNIIINILYNPNKLNNTSMNNDINQDIERYNKYGIKLDDLSSNEAAYFNLIIKYCINDSILMYEFEKKISTDYNSTNSFVLEVENSEVKIGMNEGYFQKSTYNEVINSSKVLSSFFKIVGLILLIIGNIVMYQTRLDFAFGGVTILSLTLIICSIYVKRTSYKYVLLTQFGEDEYVKWRGLYNFLNSETLLKDKTVIELPLWEKYLTYATAFGISKKVIKALNVRCPEMQSSPMLNNGYYHSRYFRSHIHSFSSHAHIASYTARGYSGGGRGGGGGGGGH